MKINNQKGFAVVEIAIIIVIVAAISYVAFKVINKNSKTSPTLSSTQAVLPSKIQSKADISLTIKALDDTPISNKLNPDQLNSSISSLL